MSCISNSNAAGMNSPMKFWHEFIFSLFSKLRSRLSQKASPCKILTTLAKVVWPPYSVANNLMSYWHSLQSQDSSVQVIYYYFAIRKNGTHVMICIFGAKLKKKLEVPSMNWSHICLDILWYVQSQNYLGTYLKMNSNFWFCTNKNKSPVNSKQLGSEK